MRDQTATGTRIRFRSPRWLIMSECVFQSQFSDRLLDHRLDSDESLIFRQSRGIHRQILHACPASSAALPKIVRAGTTVHGCSAARAIKSKKSIALDPTASQSHLTSPIKKHRPSIFSCHLPRMTSTETIYADFSNLINGADRCDEIKSSFRRVYLEALLEQCRSPQVALGKLLQCLDYFPKLEILEQKMDKTYFEEIVRSDFYMISGNSVDGRPILRIRLGTF